MLALMALAFVLGKYGWSDTDTDTATAASEQRPHLEYAYTALTTSDCRDCA